MTSGFTDWTNIGVFPLQDVEEGVPVGMRMTMAGGRVLNRPAPGANNGATLTEYAKQDGLGTLGDIHPWFFWQTKEREKRATGSWSMAWAAMVTDAWSVRYGGLAGVQPLTSNGTKMVNDHRYRVVQPVWQKALPWQPEGMLAMLMPSTDEVEPSSVMLNGDRRLVAAGASGPAQAGTTIVDMQPDGVLCMNGSEVPGQGGRHARLHGLVRVVALGSGSGGSLGGPDLNGIAINYGTSQQDGILGYGMVFGPASSGGGNSGPTTGGSGGSGTGPTTGDTGPGPGPVTYGGGGSPSSQGPGSPPPPGNPAGDDFAGPGGGAMGGNGPDGPNADREMSIADFGSFQATKRPGHAIGFMSASASGPITFGCSKHMVGLDKDGHKMTSAHISSNAYIYDSPDRDGPFMFEGLYPDQVGAHAVPSMVHLSWDAKQTHNFIGGDRSGKWRWWTTVPYVEAEDDEKDGEKNDPDTPGNPSTPSAPSGPNAPATPGGGGNPSGPTGPTTPGAGQPGASTPGAPTAPATPATPATPQGPAAPQGPKRGPITYGGIPYIDSPDPPNPPWISPLKPKGPITPVNEPKPTKPALPETPAYLTDPAGWHQNQRPQLHFPVPLGASFSGRGTDYQGTDLAPTYDTVRHKVGPSGVVDRVGGSERGRDTGLYSIFHPFNNGFAAISLRPQLWIKGAPNFEHNPLLGVRAYKTEERTRPSVLTIRAWGAQSASGDWDYLESPTQSRARGGIVDGGLLISPSEFEMEDYLGINSNADTDNPTSATYVTFAPKVAAAFGKPTTLGIPSTASKVIHQETAAGELHFSEVVAAGTLTDIAKMSLVSGQGYADFVGTHALKLPVGSTAERPASPADGMTRINSSTKLLEFYDGSAWMGTATGAVNQDKAISVILAQGAGSYTSERAVARWTPRTGTIESVDLNVSDTITANANRYWIFRLRRNTTVVAELSTAADTITADTTISMGTLANEDFDGSHALVLTVQVVKDGTNPQNLSGDYLTFDIKMGVD